MQHIKFQFSRQVLEEYYREKDYMLARLYKVYLETTGKMRYENEIYSKKRGQITREYLKNKKKFENNSFRSHPLYEKWHKEYKDSSRSNEMITDEKDNNIFSEQYWESLRDQKLEQAAYDLYCSLYPQAEIVQTPKGVDGGIDIFLDIPGLGKAVIQCKGYEKPLGRPECQQTVGAAQEHNAKPIIICPVGFNSNAISYAKKVHLELIDSPKLVKLAKSLSENK